MRQSTGAAITLFATTVALVGCGGGSGSPSIAAAVPNVSTTTAAPATAAPAVATATPHVSATATPAAQATTAAPAATATPVGTPTPTAAPRTTATPAPTPVPTPTATPAPISFVALGDSLTLGYNPDSNATAAQSCSQISNNQPQSSSTVSVPQPAVLIPPSCAATIDFPSDLTRSYLDNLNSPVIFRNVGISGVQINQVLNEELAAVTSGTTLVTLYIGTNDICNSYNADGGTITGFENDYKSILSQIATTAPNAAVYLISVPNQAVVEAKKTCANHNLQSDSQTIENFIVNTVPPLFSNVAGVLDLYNEYNAPTTFLSSDGLHPNAAGYADIANKLQAVIAQHSPLLSSRRVHVLSR